MPSASIVAALPLPRASWCREDGAHLFGVRMQLDAGMACVARRHDAMYRVSKWFAQTGSAQVPFGVELFDQWFVRLRTAAQRAGASWREVGNGEVEAHAAFVLFDVVAAQPLVSSEFGELPFAPRSAAEAPAWLHFYYHVFATRPHFLEDVSAAWLPEPGRLPPVVPWHPRTPMAVRLDGGPVDPVLQRLCFVSTRADLIGWLETWAGARGAGRKLRRRLLAWAAALDQPGRHGIEVEAASSSWQQLGALLHSLLPVD